MNMQRISETDLSGEPPPVDPVAKPGKVLAPKAARNAPPSLKRTILRALIETGFIIFLFYANLLMGEFERSGLGEKKGITWALEDVFTIANFKIAIIAAITGYLVFEFLRKKF